MTSKKEAKYYRDKHVLETKGHKLLHRGGKRTAVEVAGVDPDNYDKIYKENEGVDYEPLIEKRINFLSISDLRDYETPEYDWRVEKIIQDKKIIIIGGESATYKSWLSLNLGLCVAKGLPFLDNFNVEQGGVLFIDRENSIPELKNRTDMLENGLGLNLNEDLPIYFISEQSIKLDEFNDRKFLQEFIIEKGINLIIIDTYRRVISFEENDANSVSEFFTDELKPICEKTGVSFVLIHHHKKGRQESDKKSLLRGSSDLVNFVDGVIQVSRKGDKLTIEQTKSRSGKELEPFELKIFTDEQEMFKFEYIGEKRDLNVKSKAIEILMVWFAKEELKEFKTKEAQEYCRLNGIKRVNFFAGLKELIKQGVIQKSGFGLYEIIGKNQDLEKVQCSTLKGVEQLNSSFSNKSNCSKSSIEQVEQLNNMGFTAEEVDL